MKNQIECKILTEKIMIFFNNHVEIEALEKTLKDYGYSDIANIPEDKLQRFNISFEMHKLRVIDSYLNMWRNRDNPAFHKIHEYETENGTIIKQSIADYYMDLGLWDPEHYVATFDEQKVGLQTQPRILWNNEITKIDDIDKIISFKNI